MDNCESNCKLWPTCCGGQELISHKVDRLTCEKEKLEARLKEINEILTRIKEERLVEESG